MTYKLIKKQNTIRTSSRLLDVRHIGTAHLVTTIIKNAKSTNNKLFCQKKKKSITIDKKAVAKEALINLK